MALSSRELYLIIRAKNEATSQINTLSKDLDKARASAELMGLQSQKAHLQAEQAAQRNSKAQADYALRMMESQKATAQQAAAQEAAKQKTIEYANSMNTAQKATDQQRLSILQNQQAVDQNAVSLMQNGKAQNDLNIQRLKSVQGSGDEIAALRESNLQYQQSVVHLRDNMAARQGEINSQRQVIAATQEQINAGNQLAQNQKAVVLGAQDTARSYDDQITRQRDVVSGMRTEIADRQLQINSVNQEIASTRQANEERAMASQKMRDNGQAMMSAGAAIAVGGAIGIGAIIHLTDVAADYERQTAKTMTQTQGLGTNLKELGDIGLDVAKQFGVPFEQIQASLYDIFSSMDVSVPQAKALLADFAKAAVAGVTDVRTAGDATISIMNAYHIPVEQATRVLDEQFQTVKLGKIEYEQLAGSIGRSIPSAQRAGQQFNVLGGMIALMTRNGATASQAVTSAGRAMDLFANSKVGDRMEKIGVQTRDAAGNFRPLTSVIPELQAALSKLNPQARAAEMDALFKGSGNNIQARRFVDLVINSKTASDSFVSFSDQIKNSSGQMDQAYGTMADTVSNKNQLLKNNWHALEIELGNAFLPVLTQIVNGITGLVTWFQNLSPLQQKMLVWGIAITAALAVLVGIVVAIAGAVMVLVAAFTATIAIVAAVVIAVIAIGIALVVAYNKVEWFRDAVNAVWHSIVVGVEGLWNVMVAVWDGIVECIQGSWEDIQSIWNAIVSAVHWVGDAMSWLNQNIVQPVWQGIQSAISAAWGVIQGIWNGIKAAIDVLGQAFSMLYNTFVKPYWDLIKVEIDIIWAAIQVTWGLIQIAIKILGAAFTWLYDNGVKPAWENIKAIHEAVWNWIQTNIFNPIMAFIHGPMATAWAWFSDMINGVWNKIKDLSKAAWDWVNSNVFQPIMNFIRGPLTDVWNTLSSNISRIWGTIKDTLNSGWLWIKGNVFDPISNAVMVTIPNAFRTAVSAISTAWKAVQDVVMAPIRFVVNTVLDDGILAAYNKLASLFHVQPDNVQVTRLASGGPVWGPGGPKSDLVPAMLSNGEHVWTAAEVQAAGGQQQVARLRRLALNRQVDKFADGGPVIGKLAGVGSDITMMKGPQGGPLDWLSNVADALLDPIGTLGKVAASLFGNIPDAGAMKDMAIGVGKTAIDGIVAFAKNIMIPQVPGGGDLSGPQGNSIARILQWARVFRPDAMVSSGYRPGANDYHGMGLAADLIGGGAMGMNEIAAGFYGMSGRLLEEIHAGGPGYAVKNGMRVNGPSYYASVWADHYNHVHIAATNEALMDQGGLLRPGSTMVHNSTGGVERVLSMAQTQSFDRLVSMLGGDTNGNLSGLAPVGGFGSGGGRTMTVVVNTNEIDPRRHAMMLGMELEKQIG